MTKTATKHPITEAELAEIIGEPFAGECLYLNIKTGYVFTSSCNGWHGGAKRIAHVGGCKGTDALSRARQIIAAGMLD